MTDTPVAATTPAHTSAHTSDVCVWQVRATPIGPLLLATTERGLVHTAFHADAQVTNRSLAILTDRFGSASPHTDEATPNTHGGGHAHGRSSALASAAAVELDAYFRGESRSFTIPLDWSLASGFNRRVLKELATAVPYGTTARYQDLAELVGEPGAARAVGLAMGANPLPVVVPCHRVVESGGGIGGFGGGLETKRKLLSLEGILPEPLF